MKVTGSKDGDMIVSDIERDNDIVSATIGCQRVSIPWIVLEALTKAKQRQRGGFYHIMRDSATRRIMAVYGPVIEQDRVWTIEYHLEPPQEGQY
jgi:hypothetical protein